MQPFFNIYSIIGIIGVIQGLFLSFFLFLHRTGNRRANRMLASLLLILSVDLCGVLLDYTRYYLVYPDLYLLTEPLDWLIGPALYLYVCTLTQKDFSFTPIQLLHLIPSALFGIVLLPFLVQSPEWKLAEIMKSYQERMAAADTSGYFLKNFIFAVIFCSQPFAYIFLSFSQLRHHAKIIRDQFSSIEKINLKWLTCLLTVIIILWCVWFALYFIIPNNDDVIILPVLFSFIVYSMGYFGLRQPAIFSQTTGNEIPKKYESSALTPEMSKQFLEKLLSTMQNEKWYKDPDLTLEQLSEKINCSGRYVSQIINEQLNQNFFDFVNRYRTEEAKKLIREKPEYTVLAIAYESGFNSKSSFNAAFKKHTGQTPSEYRLQSGAHAKTMK